MKKFILNFAFFLLLILLFNSVVYLFSLDVYYKGYNKIPDKRFRKFIMSDSHGLPIRDFSENFNVYNFSSESDSYYDIQRKITYLLENNYIIDTIYLTVDDHMLSPYRESANNLDRSIIYSAINDYDNDFIYFKHKYLKYYLPILQPKIGSLIKSYLITKMKGIYNQNNKSYDNSWWKLSENKKRELAENRKKTQFVFKNKSENLEITLVEIVNICKINNIELIGIKYPLSKTYLRSIGNNNYGADEIFNSYSLKIIDKKSVFSNNDEYFANQDHLNIIGGKKFTYILLSN